MPPAALAAPRLETPPRSAPRASTPPHDRRAPAASPSAPPFDAVGESGAPRAGEPGEQEARWHELGRRLRAEHPPPAEPPPPRASRPAAASRPATASPPAADSPPIAEAPAEVVIEHLDVRVLAPEPPPARLGPPRGGAWHHDRLGPP